MSKTKAVNETFFETYKKALTQKKKIDAVVLKLEGKLLRYVQNNQNKDSGYRKTYVKRANNKSTLTEAIRKCMIPNEEMTMIEIIAALKETGLYKTHSSYFYTMVNNKLNRDKSIKKVSRGVFVLVKKTKGQAKSKESSAA